MKNKSLIIASLLILLPLIDSLFVPPVFGIQWHSPKMMYQIGVALLIIKLFMVITGIYLLLKNNRCDTGRAALETQPTARRHLLLFIVAGLQLVVMVSLCFWYLVAGTQAKYFKQQQHISVFTADYGVFTDVYHHISYICYDSYGFYRQIPVASLPWAGEFSFKVHQDSLQIYQKSNVDEQTKQISLEGFNCL
ncbi:hypothetical protein [Pseudoalteromonas sp. JSTW]|uniref:hypothetical protein n=1 Tax=Pseudoalteromonas sp. JSTW TaxID=2752475 RepID=UPI0015D5519A|nr:hypothetical protein [Pseudoalteromonas sp. JSTW]QLJ09271.1 hypothetical protein GZH31_05335 [Pseudoalteromonas sp. JSTW]